MTVVIFTGAGCSAESGLRTYRGPDGIYTHTPDGGAAGLSARMFAQNPHSVNVVLDALRTQAASLEPNAAHQAIAAFAARVPGAIVATQNVDTFLERAGCDGVLHVHGSLDQSRCVGRNHVIYTGTAAPHETPCPACGSWMRPHVVLYGEPAPQYEVLVSILGDLTPADALVVIGTEGEVVPIGALAQHLPCRRVLVNLTPSNFLPEGAFDAITYAPATVGVPAALVELEAWLQHPEPRPDARVAPWPRQQRQRLKQAWKRSQTGR